MAAHDILMGAAGGAASSSPVYVEDVFSTYLYTGNGSSQTINNGIDLLNKGGLLWVKGRSVDTNHILHDSREGGVSPLPMLRSNLTNGNEYVSGRAFTSTGFTMNGSSASYGNQNGTTYASWSFRKQAKFFDVVTYTGNGANRTIAHSLGSAPGCMMIKRTSSASDWIVYHREIGGSGATNLVKLNSDTVSTSGAAYWNNTNPTSSVFSVGTDASVNASGETYVAYLFAHNAGGFGTSGADSVISCGSYFGNSNGVDITLGWEPQWLLIKSVDTVSGYWAIVDNMRNLFVGGSANWLIANNSWQENPLSSTPITLNATGFRVTGTDSSFNYTDIDGGSAGYIYIAIRRGPMKIPTSGTSVYSAAWTQDTNTQITTNFPVDLVIDRYAYKNDAQVAQTGDNWVYDRLRGTNSVLRANATNGTVTSGSGPTFYVSTTGFQNNTGLNIGPGDGSLNNWYAQFWTFRRAPSFLDIVLYDGTGTAKTVNHNLGVAPEMMIVKRRNGPNDWAVYHSSIGPTKYMYLNSTQAPSTSSTHWNNTAPTASVFSVGNDNRVGGNNNNYVAYLFASCPGVSKIGSYTGNGSSITIDCGFSNGARFVLLKRYNASGNWVVFDTSRGIVAGNDPYLTLNATGTEISSADFIDPTSSGFIVNSVSGGFNASGDDYVYLAIA